MQLYVANCITTIFPSTNTMLVCFLLWYLQRAKTGFGKAFKNTEKYSEELQKKQPDMSSTFETVL